MRKEKELKKVLMISFTFAVLLPVIILEIFSLLFYTDYLIKEEIQHNELTSKLLSSKIEETLNNSMESLLYLKYIIENDKNRSDESIQVKLDNLVSNYNMFSQIMIIDSGANITNISPINDIIIGNSLSNSFKFIIPFETGQPYWSNVTLSEQTYLPTVHLSLPINGGVLSSSLVYSSFYDLIENIDLDYLDDKSEIEIIDNRGVLIAHTDKNRVLRREYDKNYQYLINISMEKPVTKQKEFNGKNNLVTVNNIRQTGWKIVIYYPMIYIYEPIIRINIIAGSIVFLLLLLGFLSIQLRLKLIFSPITRLLESTKLISSGDYNTTFKTENYNEFNQLTENFQLMVNNIKKREDKIMTLNRTLEISLDDAKKLQIYIQSIINSMPTIVIGIDENGYITQWNLTAEKFTSKTQKNVIGKSVFSIIPIMDLDKSKISDSIISHENISENSKPIMTDSGLKYFDILISPLFEGGELGSVIQIVDVTKRLELEDQLNHKNRMDAIGQLAGGMAHDFNNMLAGIMSSSQLLQSPKRNLDKKGLKYVDIIMNASERAADLISKLLLFGRKGHIASTNVDINTIINETVELLKRTIDKKIDLVVENKLVNSSVIGDNSALQNAFINLCINSSHALPNGGMIQITTKNIILSQTYCDTSTFNIEPGEYCEIEILDTGTGIPTESLKKIFEPFYTTKEQGKGTGLGLSAVYGTVQDHQGAITVYSDVGAGTSFHIMIPCSHYTKIIEKKSEHIFSGSGTILLVDDEELIRITGKDMLKQFGYKVILAEDGQEAVEIFRNEYSKIDIVIMDMIMPVMNGREAFKYMRDIDSSCKVVMSSGFTKDENLQDMKNDGLAGFIRKPYRDYDLSRILNDITS